MCYGFLLVKNVVLNWQNYICQTWKNSPNVLVVYILSGEGHRGVGYDLRRRGIWDWFPSHPELREQAVTPSLHTRYPYFILCSRIRSRYILPGPFVTWAAVIRGIWDLLLSELIVIPIPIPYHSDLKTPSLPRSSYGIYSAVDWGKRICMYGQVPGSSLGYFSEWNFNLALCLFHIIFLFLSVLGDRSNVLFFFFPVWTQLARHSWETYLMFPDNEHLY